MFFGKNNLISFTRGIFLLYYAFFYLLTVLPSYGEETNLYMITGKPSATPDSPKDTQEAYHIDIFIGSFIYSVPIVVLPGTNGMQPSISLNYNSMSSGGWCGIGWDLSLGKIGRSLKKGVPTYTSSDKFHLDGMSIVSSPDGYWHTELESFYRIEKIPGSTNLEDWWKVTDKSGKVYSYGSTANSRIIAYDQSGQARGIFEWHLDSISDLHVNSLQITYDQSDPGVLYPSQILYTKHNGEIIGQSRIIDLISVPRPDVIVSYAGGFFSKMTKRLSEIHVKLGGELKRKYVLTYGLSSDSQLSLLSNVTLYGSDGISSMPSYNFTYQSNNQKGFVNNNAWLLPIPLASLGGTELGTRIVDINGDVFPDIIRSQVGWGQASYRNTGSGWVQDNTWLPPVAVPFVSSTGTDLGTRIVDVNGDGLPDIIRSQAGWGQIAYRNTGAGWVQDNTWLPPAAIPFANNSGRDLGVRIFDINGDGLPDIVKNQQNVGPVIYLNAGNGWVHDNSWLPSSIAAIVPFSTSLGKDAGTRLFDVNGDGKIDILRNWYAADSGLTVSYITSGTSWIQDNNWNSPLPFGNITGGDTGVVIADVNGDGLDDIIQYWSNTGQVSKINKGKRVDLLINATNPLGGTISVGYQPSSIITNTFLPFPLSVVTKLITDDGRGTLSTTNYQYEGGLYDFTNREFRGFYKTTVTDPEGNVSMTQFHQTDARKGRPLQIQQKDSQGNLLRETLYTWAISTLFLGVAYIHLDSLAANICDGNTPCKQTRTDYTYDLYGNTTSEEHQGDLSVTGDEHSTHALYIYDLTNWIVATPSWLAIKDAASTIRKQSWLTYDILGRLIQREDWLEGGINPVTTLGYDEYGNVTTVTNPLNHTVTITYDPTYHAFPSTVINPLGHIESYIYDPALGVVTSYIDSNGNITTFSYDVLGRPIKIIRPLDSDTTPTVIYAYTDWGDPSLQKILRAWRVTSGTIDVYTEASFLDGLGRTYRQERDADAGVAIQNVSFDARGLVTQAEVPHYTTETPRLESYQYDPLRRLIKLTNVDGTYRTTAYDRWTLTMTDELSHTRKQTLDFFGRVKKVEEFLGVQTFTTTYDYSVLGDVTRVVDAEGNTTTMTYNSLGQKTAMDDPDMGHWEYFYDLAGRLIRQKDAKGQEVRLYYDALGRMVMKDNPPMSSTTNPGHEDVVFIYDDPAVPNSKGRLTKMTDPTGSTSFRYDARGRVTEMTKVIYNQSFTIQVTYDASDRIKTLTYPDGEIVTYTHLADHVKSIVGTMNGSPYEFVKNVVSGSDSRIRELYFGNGATTTFTYDPATLRLTNIKTLVSTSGIQDLDFTLDGLGQVTYLVDKVLNITQNFSYDDLGRLIQTTYTPSGGTTETQTWQYDSIGNILAGPGGTYTYSKVNAGPHAVTTLVDPLGGFSGKGSKRYEYRKVIEDMLHLLEQFYDRNALTPGGGEDADPNKTAYTYLNFFQAVYEILIDSGLDLQGLVSFFQYDPEITTHTGELISRIEKKDLNALLEPEDVKLLRNILHRMELLVAQTKSLDPTYDFQYDANGNMVAATGDANISITYDEANRMTSFADGTNTTQFFYDGFGNRVKKISPTGDTKLYFGKLFEVRGNVLIKNIFMGSTLVASIVTGLPPPGDGGGGCSCKTAVCVNQSSGLNDIFNGLILVGSPCLFLIFLKGRVLKGGFLYRDHRWKLFILFVATTFFCYSFPKMPAQAMTTGDRVFFYHPDHLGSLTMMTDETGTVVQRIEYTPAGGIRSNVTTGPFDPSLKFTGQEYDAETGAYFYGARYYHPKLGRFLSPDPLIPDPLNPQSFNRYTYALNNPLMYIDPSGYFAWAVPIAFAVVGAVIGAAIGYGKASPGQEAQGALVGAAIGAVIGFGIGMAIAAVATESAAATGLPAGWEAAPATGPVDPFAPGIFYGGAEGVGAAAPAAIAAPTVTQAAAAATVAQAAVQVLAPAATASPASIPANVAMAQAPPTVSAQAPPLPKWFQQRLVQLMQNPPPELFTAGNCVQTPAKLFSLAAGQPFNPATFPRADMLVEIPPSQLQAGDLGFWKNAAGMDKHIAVYNSNQPYDVNARQWFSGGSQNVPGGLRYGEKMASAQMYFRGYPGHPGYPTVKFYRFVGLQVVSP